MSCMYVVYVCVYVCACMWYVFVCAGWPNCQALLFVLFGLRLRMIPFDLGCLKVVSNMLASKSSPSKGSSACMHTHATHQERKVLDSHTN